MKIDTKLVDELAYLARLKFNDGEKQEMVNDMNNMLGFVDKLNEINTDGIDPLIYMVNETNVLRNDEDSKNTVTHNEALSNAPKKDSDYFRVPKVIDNK